MAQSADAAISGIKMFTRRNWFFSWLAGALRAQTTPWITHGPMLGRPGARQMGIWARTAQAGAFCIRYGLSPDRLDLLSPPIQTRAENDNTAWTLLTGLTPNTTYYYTVLPVGQSASTMPADSFRTLQDSAVFVHPQLNPKGLFNFAFEAGSCNNQNPDGGDPAARAYRTMLEKVAPQVDFSIMNGDWIYEERRDYPLEAWMAQAGVDGAHLPELLKTLPGIVGVWENYKLYLQRAPNLAAWHKRIPTYYTYDDHEVLGDIYGAGEVGRRNRLAVFRDPALKAWYDYLGWSNPPAYQQEAIFGIAELKGGSDILVDQNADFSHYDKAQGLTLHVHWGGPDAGFKVTNSPGAPNAGIYEVVEVLDRHRVRIRPSPPVDGRQSYSIGKRSHYDFRYGNAHFFALDCRGERNMHDTSALNRHGVSMLGAVQKEWLKAGMKATDADFLFVISPVNMMICHSGGTPNLKGDSWPMYLEEREELVRFFDSLGKPVLILSADFHVSYTVKVTERIWEISPGPHCSPHHPVGAAGYPPNGTYDSFGRPAEMRWCTFMRDDVSPVHRRKPMYAVIEINNVFRNPTKDGKERYVAWPVPFVSVRHHDGLSGDLLYAETIHARQIT